MVCRGAAWHSAEWYGAVRCGMVGYAFYVCSSAWLQKVLGSDVLAPTERFATNIEAQTCDAGPEQFCVWASGLTLRFRVQG